MHIYGHQEFSPYISYSAVMAPSQVVTLHISIFYLVTVIINHLIKWNIISLQNKLNLRHNIALPGLIINV